MAVRLRDIIGASGPVALRLATAVIAGLAAGLTAVGAGRPHYAIAAGWITTGIVYLVWTWVVLWPMDAEATRQHALSHERDGTRRLSHAVILVASLTSLAGVGILLHATSGDKPDLLAGSVGVLSVVISWLTVHTVYMTRYARLYYTAPDPRQPGMNFDGEPPAYLDFGYVAFTIGMCYAVPDTGLSNRKLRRAVLSQGALSYVYGTFIIATTLNLVSGLAS